MFNTPILFLIFNRLDTTKQVFEAIKKAKPQYFYIAADGPRTAEENEAHLCAEVREFVLKNIDWDCKIKTLFRTENLGCGKAVSQAITWFFENVEEGIILEDDCLPDISFFRFWEELLEKYREDEEIMAISGSNLLGKPWKENLHSYFWSFPFIWGWATWRKAWALYDFDMNNWNKDEIKEKIRKSLKTRDWIDFYEPMLELTFTRKIDTWDLQWLYTVLLHGGLTANCSINLIKNIGFGSSGTHTSNAEGAFANLALGKIEFPLIHINNKMIDIEYLEHLGKFLIPKPITKANHKYSFKDLLKKIIFAEFIPNNF